MHKDTLFQFYFHYIVLNHSRSISWPQQKYIYDAFLQDFPLLWFHEGRIFQGFIRCWILSVKQKSIATFDYLFYLKFPLKFFSTFDANTVVACMIHVFWKYNKTWKLKLILPMNSRRGYERAKLWIPHCDLRHVCTKIVKKNIIACLVLVLGITFSGFRWHFFNASNVYSYQ